MHWPILTFLWLFINSSSIFLILHSLSHIAKPRAIAVKCEGYAYNVDVESQDSHFMFLNVICSDLLLHIFVKIFDDTTEAFLFKTIRKF